MNKTILGIIMLENICLFGKPMDTHTHILMSVGVEFLLIKSQEIQGQFQRGFQTLHSKYFHHYFKLFMAGMNCYFGIFNNQEIHFFAEKM